jgi:type VI protein secretion system component Hcp
MLHVSQLVPSVKLEFTKTDGAGKEYVDSTITLGNARVVKIVPRAAVGVSGQDVTLECEEVEMTFRKIEFSFKQGGKTYIDDWR